MPLPSSSLYSLFITSCLWWIGSGWQQVASSQMPAALWMFLLVSERTWLSTEGFLADNRGWVKAKSRTEPWWTLVTRMAFAIQQTFIRPCCGLLFSHVSPHPVLSYPVSRHFSSFSIWKADTEMFGDPLLGLHLGPAEGRIWTVSKLVFLSMSQLPLLHPRHWWGCLLSQEGSGSTVQMERTKTLAQGLLGRPSQ